jgi:hypothetical protein
VHASLSLALVLSVVLPAQGAARSPPEIRKLAADIALRLDLQRDLPLSADATSWFWIPPPELVWAVLIALGAVLLYAIVAHVVNEILPLLRHRRRAQWPGRALDGGADRSPLSSEAMLAADELARQGRFVEAMHALLLEGLAELRLRLDNRFADSLTSREILRRARLSEPGRVALRDMIAGVELTYFGARPARPADYQSCRASFAALARALGDAASA